MPTISYSRKLDSVVLTDLQEITSKVTALEYVGSTYQITISESLESTESSKINRYFNNKDDFGLE